MDATIPTEKEMRNGANMLFRKSKDLAFWLHFDADTGNFAIRHHTMTAPSRDELYDTYQQATEAFSNLQNVT